MLGQNKEGEVLFRYINTVQGINQTFGLSIKSYKPHLQSNFVDKEGNDNPKIFDDDKAMTPQDSDYHHYMRLASEGAYTLRPEIDDDRKSFRTYQYSQINKDIIYQDGVNLDQYTIIFNKQESHEQAVVNLRFSPKFFSQLIEFDVEMN